MPQNILIATTASLTLRLMATIQILSESQLKYVA